MTEQDKMKEICTRYFNEMCEMVGENPKREGLLDTPRRIARAMEFFLSGYAQDKDIPGILARQFTEENYNELVIIDNIDFFSNCEHHISPFFGKVHVGYIPSGGKVVGASKIPRVVDIYARRLQQQERFTNQIADAIEEHLQPKGIIVYVEGIHLCMRSRGVQKPNTTMKTAEVRGLFKEEPSLEQKFYQMINMGTL